MTEKLLTGTLSLNTTNQPFIMVTCHHVTPPISKYCLTFVLKTHTKKSLHVFTSDVSFFYNRTFQHANTDFKSSVDLHKPHADIISCKHLCTTPAIVFLQNLRNWPQVYSLCRLTFCHVYHLEIASQLIF